MNFGRNIKSLRTRGKYVVIFCVKEANTYSFIEYKTIKPDTQSIKYGNDKQFIVDIENPTYRNKNESYFCIDVNAKQIYFKDLKESDIVSSRVNKMVMVEQVIYQLAKATTTPITQSYDWKTAIIFLIIGTLLGFILKIFIPM